MPFIEKQVCSVSYPGLRGVDSASYSYNQGVQADEINVTVKVEPLAVLRYGDFTFSDGVRSYVVPDCRVESIRPNFGKAGNSWQIILKDHRWRWEDSEIDGEYNLEDNHQNLVTGFVKTPRELVEICLKQLKEENYDVSKVPEGVKEGDVPDNQFPGAGEGVKSTKPELNPKIFWDAMPTREALARLCDQFYMVPVWCNLERRVRIEKRSVGELLPEDHVDGAGGAINLPPIPTGVGVRGAPIRFQFRAVLDAVAPEWDTQLRTIDVLSYAPVNQPRPGEVQVICQTPFLTGQTFLIVIEGRPFAVTGTTDAAQVLTDLAALIAADPVIGSTVSVSVGGGPQLVITGTQNGQTPLVERGDALATLTATVTSVGVQTAWEFCCPPLFPGVHPTDRLSFNKAMALAQSGVFKMYRLTLLDPGRGPKQPQATLNIARYGKVLDLHNIIPFNSRVEQVVPTARDPNRIRGGSGDIIADVPDYYDGWSRDRSTEIFGAIYNRHSSPVHRRLTTAKLNTEFEDRVEVPFSFDPGSYCVTFASPVLEVVPVSKTLKVAIPRLVFEFSAYLRHPKTHEILRYRRWIKFAKEKGEIGDKRKSPKKLARKDNDLDATAWDHDPNIRWFSHDDVIRSWVHKYSVDNTARRMSSTGSDADEYDNATAAADKYLDAHLDRIVLEGGVTIHYKGVTSIKLDGAIGQLTMDYGREGLSTSASRNVEHDNYIPTYDTRRFKEAVRPDAEAARQNKEYAKPALIGSVFAKMGQGGGLQRNG